MRAGPAASAGVVQAGFEGLVEGMAVEEKDRVGRLILDLSDEVGLEGKVIEERLDLGSAHMRRVSFFVEDKWPYPGAVGLFGFEGVVLAAEHGASLLEQFSK